LSASSQRAPQRGLGARLGELWYPYPHRVPVPEALHPAASPHPSWCSLMSSSPPCCEGKGCKSHCPGVCTVGLILCQSQRRNWTRCSSLFLSVCNFFPFVLNGCLQRFPRKIEKHFVYPRVCRPAQGQAGRWQGQGHLALNCRRFKVKLRSTVKEWTSKKH